MIRGCQFRELRERDGILARSCRGTEEASIESMVCENKLRMNENEFVRYFCAFDGRLNLGSVINPFEPQLSIYVRCCSIRLYRAVRVDVL